MAQQASSPTVTIDGSALLTTQTITGPNLSTVLPTQSLFATTTIDFSSSVAADNFSVSTPDTSRKTRSEGRVHETATIITLSEPPLASQTDTTQMSIPTSKHRPVGAIVGGVIGGLLSIAVLVTFLLCLKRQRRKRTTRIRPFNAAKRGAETLGESSSPETSPGNVVSYPVAGAPATLESILAPFPSKGMSSPNAAAAHHTFPSLAYHVDQQALSSSEPPLSSSPHLHSQLSELRGRLALIQQRGEATTTIATTTTKNDSAEMMELIRGLQKDMQSLEAQIAGVESSNPSSDYPALSVRASRLNDFPPDYSSTIASVYNLRDHR